MSKKSSYPTKIILRINLITLFLYNYNKKQILKSAQELVNEGLIFKNYLLVNYSGLKNEDKELYTEMFVSAVRFRFMKRDIKKIIDTFTGMLFMICLIICPFIMDWYFGNKFNWSSIGIVLLSFLGFIISMFILAPISQYLEMISIKVGNWISSLSAFLFTVLLLIILYRFYPLYDYNFLCKLFLIIGLSLLGVIFFTIFNLIVLKSIVDIVMYSAKIRLTDELILESVWKLVNSNTKIQTIVRKRNKRNELLLNIENLAQLIQYDWANHVRPKDPRYSKWKQRTFAAVADDIRKLKKSVMFPDKSQLDHLTNRFRHLLDCIITHDLCQLIPDEMPAYRIKKKSVLKIIKGILVAIIPIILTLLLYREYCDYLPKDYHAMPVIIASGWLLLNLVLWLDPNLGDKIKLLSRSSNFMSTINNDDDD